MIDLEKGSIVSFSNSAYRIRRISADYKSVVAVNVATDTPITIPLSELKAWTSEVEEEEFPAGPIETYSEKEIELAKYRFSILEEFLDETVDPLKLEASAKKNGVGKSTIYKWRSRYIKTGLMTSLIDRSGRGGKGKSRLPETIDSIITDCIELYYKKKKSITKTYRMIKIECEKENLSVPNINTLKHRIAQIPPEELIGKRRGSKKKREMFGQVKGTIPGAETPYQMVQIDHTLLDIILLEDDEFRRPLGRPWMTLPMDVCTRIPTGFYISIDTPGNYGTGQALAMSFFPKDKLLAMYNIEEEWPMWGPIRTLHCDNAGEFHSKMLEMACLKYGIKLNFRPVATPHYGGHIERIMGTINKELHDLPGTTFSNSQERKYYEYDSKMYAGFTLKEFEEYLVNWFTRVYMLKFHKGLGMAPIERLKQFLVGTPEIPAIGTQPMYHDFEKTQIDFLPFEERTIQTYGVDIDNFRYQSEHLRPFVNMKIETEFKKTRAKRKFIFKVDPQDLSRVFFAHPDSETYYVIPLNNRAGYPMTKWEKREVERKLKAEGKEVNEAAIMKGYKKLKELEDNAVKKTAKAKKNAQRRATAADKSVKYSSDQPAANEEAAATPIDYSKLKTFELDHESFN
jgi:putative transposase